MRLDIYEVNAFSEGDFTGNPAAVCFLPEPLSEKILLAIAAQNNLPATAFIWMENERYRIRWFFPEHEIPLCGHGTLAASYVIFHHLQPNLQRISFESNLAKLYAQRKGELISLDFPASITLDSQPSKNALDAVNCHILQAVTSHDTEIFVLEDEQAVQALMVDFDKLQTLDRRRIIFTAPGEDVDFVSRVFYPKYQVKEDPVCGSAHCQLAPYWVHRLSKTHLSARQLSPRGGALLCEVADNQRIVLSGRCTLYLQGQIEFSI